MKKLFVVFSLASMAFLVSCGDETTYVTETTGMTLVEKGKKMPSCTAVNAGEMAYSMDSLAAFFCADGKWQSLKGERGEQGEKGKQGEIGEKGDDGKSCTAKALADGSGYKIVCGGDSVGVVYHGFVDIPSSSSIESSNATAYVAPCKTDLEDNCKYGELVDNRDGQTYKTVVIGTQTWMAENLNYATEVNGTDSSSFCLEDDGNKDRGAANCVKFGRLYTWAAAVGRSEEECGVKQECNLPSGNIRGVCPKGWHVPSSEEWKTLLAAVGGIQETGTDWWKWYGAGTVLKSNTEGWKYNDAGESGKGTDAYGFTALPAGLGWKLYGICYDFSHDAVESTAFWSSTEDGSEYAHSMDLLYRFEYASFGSGSAKDDAYSVRCLKD